MPLPVTTRMPVLLDAAASLEAACRIVDDRDQQPVEVSGQTLDGGGIEEAGVILQLDLERARAIPPAGETEIVGPRAPGQRVGLRRHALEPRAGRRRRF